MLFKLHYTFLIDKLLRPNEKVPVSKYNVFNDDVQKMAIKRRYQLKRHKVKLEMMKIKMEAKKERNSSEDDDDEDDLETIKQRLTEEKRKRAPGRFYIDKSRGSEAICEREARIQAAPSSSRQDPSLKRSHDEMVGNLGYMESSKKKNKRSAGSFIQADPTKHIMENGIVDTGKLFEDYGLKNIESMQNHHILNIQNQINQALNAPLVSRSSSYNNGWKLKHEVKSEVKKEFVKREGCGFAGSTGTSKHEEIVLDSDSDREDGFTGSTGTKQHEEIILDDSDSDVEDGKGRESKKGLFHDRDDELDLPPGIVMIPRQVDTNVEDDDVVCLSGDEADNVDVKPTLKELVAKLGDLPEISICSSDSEEEVDDESSSRSRGIEMVMPQSVHEDLIDNIAVDEDDQSLMETNDSVAEEMNETSEADDHPSELLETELNIHNESTVDESCSGDIDKNKSVDEHALSEGAAIISRIEKIPASTDVLPMSPVSIVSNVSPTVDEADLTESNEVFHKRKETKSTSSAKSGPEHVDKRLQESGSTTPASPKVPVKSATVDTNSNIIYDINKTIIERQEKTLDYLVLGNIAVNVSLYDKAKESKLTQNQEKLKPMPGAFIQEFDDLGTFEEESAAPQRRRGRKKKVGAVDEKSVPEDSVTAKNLRTQGLLSSILRLNVNASSKTLLTPKLLNILWHNCFLQDTKCVAVKAEDFLLQHFMCQYERTNREVLMTNILNSLRNVRDPKVFKDFNISNVVDITEVASFLSDAVDRFVDGDSGDFNKEMLKILMKITQKDFTLWWRHDRSKRKGNFPMIYYLFGGEKNFEGNVQRIIPKLLKKIVEDSGDEVGVRNLVAMTAMMTAFIDYKEREETVERGLKMKFAESIANVLEEVGEQKLFSNLFLLQPSWFSFLVSKILIERRISNLEKKRVFKMMDINELLKNLSVNEHKEGDSHLLEMCAYKMMNLTYPHILLRANWFFSNKKKEDEKFEVFSKMKELTLEDDKTSKRKKKDFTSKSLVKVSLSRQTQDLQFLTGIAKGNVTVTDDQDNRDVERGAAKALWFGMTQESDLEWHPRI